LTVITEIDKIIHMSERTAKTFNVSTQILAGVCEANSKLKTAVSSFEHNRQQATGNRQQATGNRQQATGNRQQATGNRQL
jgi:hypothetical protein